MDEKGGTMRSVESSQEEDTREERFWRAFWKEEEDWEDFKEKYFKVWGYYPRRKDSK